MDRTSIDREPGEWPGVGSRTIECLAAKGSHDEAEPHLIESAEVLLEKLGPANPRVREAVERVAVFCEQRQDPDAARLWRARLGED